MKKLISLGQYSNAIILAEKELKSENNVNKISNIGKQLDKIPNKYATQLGYQHKKIAVLGGYNTSYFIPLIKSALLLKGIWAEVYEDNYGTGELSIVSKSLDLEHFAPDICYLCYGHQHLDPELDVDLEVTRWTTLFNQVNSWLKCEVIFNSFIAPQEREFGQYSFKNANSKRSKIQELNRCLKEHAGNHVHFLDTDYLSSYVGLQNWFDQRLYDLAKVPCNMDYWLDYIHLLSSVVAAIYGKTKKVLVLDLDNTLWGGVIGDDGIEGIRVGETGNEGESFKRFQEYIKSLKERGVILAVASKNEEAIAKEPFKNHPQMVLREDDISCFVANWKPKNENIQMIAQHLNLGLDSFVFFDDNPAEREIVSNFLPQVQVIDVPDDPSKYINCLDQSLAFDIVSLSNEDLERTKKYAENNKRLNLKSSFESYDDYLKGLEMVGTVSDIDHINISRCTQLINKTNQFNLTTKRYSQSEVESMLNSNNHICRSISLKDKFGDNGIISVFIGKVVSDTLYIDIWLMSCRVLKRNVEAFTLQVVLSELRKIGINRVIGEFIPTQKNDMVKDLYSSFNFMQLDSSTSKNMKYSISLEHINFNDEPFINFIKIGSKND